MKRRCWVVMYKMRLGYNNRWIRSHDSFDTKKEALGDIRYMKKRKDWYRNIGKPIKVEEPCGK